MKSKLFKGALFVTLATLFVKVLSIVYKVPYQNITGDQGFYIYQQLYPVYSLFISMATFAFPLAISETLNTKKHDKATLSSIFTILITINLLICLIILFFNQPLGLLFNDYKLSPLFYSLIPVLLLIPIVSVIRGYLYASPNLLNKVGYSLIIEQLFRVSFIVFSLFMFKKLIITDIYVVANYSLLGFGIGLLFTSFFLIYSFDFCKFNLKIFDYHLGVVILKRGLFLLISSSMLIILQLIDSLTIIKVLAKFMSLNEAMINKGIYDRGLPLIQTALFFVSPLISSFLPHLKSKTDISKLLILIILFALPATIGLIFVTEDLNNFLFKDNKLTLTLQINALIILFYAVFLTLVSVVKNTKQVTLVILIGIIIKFILNIFFINKIGINGAPLSSIITLTILILTVILSNKFIIKLNYKTLVKITLSSLMMVLILFTFRLYLSDNLFLTILLGIVSYCSSLFILKLHKADILIKS